MLRHHGPDASGGARRAPHPGRRRSGGGQEAGQPLSAPDIVWGAYLLLPLGFLRRLAAWPVTYLAVTDRRMVLVGGLASRTAARYPWIR